MDENKKEHHLHIVLTTQQYQLLCCQAKECRLTKRAYLARSVNAGIAKPEDAERGLYLLDQVYELMFRIANK